MVLFHFKKISTNQSAGLLDIATPTLFSPLLLRLNVVLPIICRSSWVPSYYLRELATTARQISCVRHELMWFVRQAANGLASKVGYCDADAGTESEAPPKLDTLVCTNVSLY